MRVWSGLLFGKRSSYDCVVCYCCCLFGVVGCKGMVCELVCVVVVGGCCGICGGGWVCDDCVVDFGR